MMEGARAACTALSHPEQLLLVLLWAPTCLCCLCRCPESHVLLNPACSCFFGTTRWKYCRLTQPRLFAVLFTWACLGIQSGYMVYDTILQKYHFLTICVCHNFLFFSMSRSSVIWMEIFYLPQNYNINILAGWNSCNLRCDWPLKYLLMNIPLKKCWS